MSYQLEREMFDRVTRYHDEAAVRRAVPGGDLRRNIAAALRKLADRLEARGIATDFTVEQANVVLHGRNN